MGTPQKKRFFILDGFGLFFKAYFALPNLTSPDGQPTGAIFGFSNILKKILTSEKPDYLAVAIDMEGKTFRDDLFEQYKANRPEIPADLAVQIPSISKICEVFNLPFLGFQGYEADDVIGTLCKKLQSEEIQIVIVSSDKDLYQLVNDNVIMMDIRKNNETQYYDSKTGEEKFGVRPDQMIDKLSLTGDASDNVPGAPGIGEKGAILLLKEYDHLENLFTHSSEIKSKRYRESLQNHKDQILLSKQLVTIKTDLEFPFQLDTYAVKGINETLAAEFFAQMNFRSLLKELKLNTPEKKQSASEVPSLQWHFYETETLPKLKGTLVCLPIYGEPKGIGGAFLLKALLLQKSEENELHCLKTSHPQFSAWLKTFLKQKEMTLIVAEIKSIERSFDTFWPSATFANQLNHLEDLTLRAYLKEPNQRDFRLPFLAQHFLQVELKNDALTQFSQQLQYYQEKQTPNALQEIPLKDVEPWIRCLWQLHEELQSLSADLEKVYREIELPLSLVLARIENRGVYCEKDQLLKLSEEFTQILEEASAQIYKIAGEHFNINSPKQLGQILFEKLKLPTTKKTKGGEWSTNEEVLTELGKEHELPAWVLRYRHFSKLKSTYIDALPSLINQETNRIHTTFHQTGASTGRLSSTDPNLQNIPIRTSEGQKIRSAFTAEGENLIVTADYSQIELRIFAHLSEDSVLCDSFRKNEDIHERTAREIFGNYLDFEKQEMRRRAKTINFGVIYGQSPYGLATQLGISQKEAKTFIENYFERYKGVKKWLDQAIQEAKSVGYAKTLFGRIRPIPELKSSNRAIQNLGERTAINTPVQGTAADLIKMAMIRVENALQQAKLKSKMVLTVHDELVFEVPPKELSQMKALVKTEMENVYPFCVPLVVNIESGHSWASAK